MEINKILAKELGLKEEQVEKTIALIDEGNTIPFIARYRKEVTGNLTDTTLRDLEVRLNYLRNLKERKEDVLRLLEEQGNLTEELEKDLHEAMNLQAVEDIYRPYKPKKRTRATIAKEKGLEPLAEYLLDLENKDDPLLKAKDFIDEDKGVLDEEEALEGALDILAEQVSDNVDNRNLVRKDLFFYGHLTSLKTEDADGTYESYHDFSEPVKALKPHRTLAIFRGEKEGQLKVGFETGHELNIKAILKRYIKEEDHPHYPYLLEMVEDAYKRLLFPSIETETRTALKEIADEESIKVFSSNLRPYLLQPPLHGHSIMGLDPGFRTGCKVAVIDKLGTYKAHGTIFPTKPFEKIAEARKTLLNLIEKYHVDVIAIGNGTASRETESFVANLIKEEQKDVKYVIVSESGASIYSASKLAEEEFPELDVTIRGAISIARRLLDPLAELVKIEPKHIGVGQYQHDINQKLLGESLHAVVEDCVNHVGVDVNRASVSLLSYVAGISKKMAKEIILHKENVGPFKNRKELLKVKGIGPKSFEQAAGFLRIPESDNKLDNTGVHPESYDVAMALLESDLYHVDVKETSERLGVGIPTLEDIIKELKKPGRDPRDEMPKPILRSDVLSIDDLEEGMVLKGTVRNVVDFGAFVDIGIKQDGLVHVSELSDRFVKHPSDVVTVSDIVEVKIIKIDRDRHKVGLSMKGIKQS